MRRVPRAVPAGRGASGAPADRLANLARMTSVDETHDPALRSWVQSANASGCDFPIQNLPFAAFRRAGSHEPFRGAVAIGDEVLDLGALHGAGVFDGAAGRALAAAAQPTLNALMGEGRGAAAALRRALSGALRTGSALESRLRTLLVPQRAAEYRVAAEVGDYTDFYASIHHATSVGRLFRPDNPLLPNYKWVPIAYHGRASSIRVSGFELQRPVGQLLPPGAAQPVLGPTRRLDYELEVGVFIGRGNALGEPVPLAQAEEHVFGLCLLNDWSARDIQSWEYQPLGPFLAKNFATTVSPWVVTLEALIPYRTAWTRPAGEPPPLAYLDDEPVRRAGGFDLRLEVWLDTAKMRARGIAAQRLSHSNFRDSWWTVSQMVAHHTVNGCNLRPGDLFGSGTQSGPAPDEAGSLLELSGGGKRPIALGEGESRTFLEDGDRVSFRAWCEREGLARIGFGELTGTVRPAA